MKAVGSPFYVPAQSILYIDHTAQMGGGEIALFNLIEAIDRDRFKPVAMLFADGPLLQKLTEAKVPTHLLKLSSEIADARKDTLHKGLPSKLFSAFKTLGFIVKVSREIRRINPALIHTNSLKADIIGGLAGRWAGVPVIWHVRDRIADDYLPEKVARVFRWLARFVPSYVIANSQSTLNTLDKRTRGVAIASGLAGKSWQSVIHDGTFIADEVDQNGIEGDTLLIGLVGRITRWKGQHVFIEAAKHLREKCPKCRYLIIGSALFGEEEYDREIRNLVERENLTDIVEFTGFRKDIGNAINELDILVHASITGEPFGQVIVEGMAAGKPVVATHGGGVPEIVEDGKSGFLVPMGDVVAMADAIEKLVHSPALRRTMGEAGRKRVAEHFTIARTADRVQQVYDVLLGNAAAGQSI